MQLAMRRQEFNWTVEQVASQLNLAPRQVLAMEADDYGALPGMAVARGFIRSYAKLLKLDSAPMLAQIAKAPGSAEQAIPLRRAIPSTTFQPHRGAMRSRQGGPSKLLLASGVIIAAGLAAAAFSQREQIAGLLPASISGFMNRAPSPGPSSAEQKDGKIVDTEVAPPLHQSEAAATAQAPAGMTPELSPPASPAATAAAPAAASAPQPGSSLVLKMRQDSWVEVRRADNTIVTSRVLRAGSTEIFELDGPLKLTVGNARGVDATVRGAPLDLAGTTRNNVARVNVK
jgi:cytoskeleton protein RodZ